MNSSHSSSSQVVLITGASSGLGQVCAQHLADLGHRVYGTSRRAALPGPAESGSSPVMIPMDVCREDSVRAALDLVLEREGRIDVVINNAGVGLAGAIEDCSAEETRELFETNFFGVLRVCRAVLPTMREQHSGLIVNIGSLGGIVAIPFQGMYSASKSALGMLSDALRMEVRRFGVRVTLIEPGDFKTEFTGNRVFSAASQTNPAYTERCRKAVAVMEHDEQNGADPRQLAELVARVIGQASPKPRYRVGMPVQKLIVALRPFIPGVFFEKFIGSYYK